MNRILNLLIELLFLLASVSSFAADPCHPISKETRGESSIIRYTERLPSKDYSQIVIVMPPTGGTNLIDRSYAAGLCEKGIGAVTLDHWTNDDEYNLELEIHTRFYRRAQAAVDLLLAQYRGKSFGILGTSVGALHGSIAFARVPQIRSGFFIVGGAPIAEIIVHSNQAAMVTAREERFKLYGFKSDGEYLAALKKVLPFEPLEIKFDRQSKRLGLIVSTKDLTVPTANQILLREKWLPDVGYTTSWSHVLAIVKTWLFDKSKVIDFFSARED